MKYLYIILFVTIAFPQEGNKALVDAVNNQILHNENTISLLESQIDSTKNLINEIKAIGELNSLVWAKCCENDFI